MNTKTGQKKPVKAMLFSYLAISKLLYWINIVSTTYSLDGVWRAVLQRLLYRDIVLIIVIVFIHLFEEKLVMKQKKQNGIIMRIISSIAAYVAFVAILTVYTWVYNLIFSYPFSLGSFLLSSAMRYWTIIFFAVMCAMIAKEHFKKKEAAEYALEIQSTDIKLEMLKTLLDDGDISQEEFDKQKTKLHEI